MSASASLERIGVGIDTARYGHRVSFRRPDHQPAAKPITVMETQAGYQALREQLERLHQQHPQAHFHVRIDAAGQYAANLERFLRGLDLPMTLSIGEPKRNKDYQKAHFPKRTSDDTESQAMARFAVVELPKATLPLPRPMILLREVAGRLQAQVKQTTQAINRLHNLLARVFPELATLANDFSARWVLQLLDKYPTPQRIAQARLASLEKIPHLPQDKAEPLHLAAQQSVGSLSGAVAETLVRDLVTQVRHCQHAEQKMRQLLTTAFADLPASGHVQLVSIPGIGAATAAVLTAKIVDIDRFDMPDHLVGYFGTFPEENSSGVDKQGNPLPAGTLCMSRKGNDLVRHYLWNAARVGIRYNPALRALYRRLKAKGKRGDVAIGHCMRKLLHLVFAVWKTNRPFDDKHFPWEASDSQVSTPAVVEPAVAAQADSNEKAAGHKRDMPAQKVVTTANSSVEPATAAVNAPTDTVSPAPAAAPATVRTPTEPASPTPAAATPTVNAPTSAAPAVATPKARPQVDFAFVRQQITMEQVLRHLGFFDSLRGRSQQRRGPCPVHGQATDRKGTFSVHLGKNICQCFQADCAAQGNVLDLWAALHRLPLYEAVLHLAETFHLHRNREEERVRGAP
jgi:transposase